MKRVSVIITAIVFFASCSDYDGEVAILPSSFHSMDELIDSVELIPLQQSPNNYLGSMVELSSNDDSWVIYDKPNCKIHIYSKEGKYLNNIGHRGNSLSEFLTIQNVQIHDTMCVVYSIPGKVNRYAFDGSFIRSEQHPLIGDNTILLPEGYLSYMGYKPTIDHRLRLIQDDKIRQEYLQTNHHVLNMMSGEPVFYEHNEFISIVDSYSDIVYSYNDGRLDPIVRFDFGDYEIPDEFYKYSDVYEGAEFLLQSNFARVSRFMGNNDMLFVEVVLQNGSEAHCVYAVKYNNLWKWFDVNDEYTLFEGTFRKFEGNTLIAILDAEDVYNMPIKVRSKVTNCEVMSSIYEEGNYVIAKVRIK